MWPLRRFLSFLGYNARSWGLGRNTGDPEALGTPVEGGPKYTAAGSIYAEKRGLDLDEFEQRVHEMNREGVGVPLTVIYSRTDAIVSWRAAIDRYNPQAKHVQVPGSHVGLAFSPRVWRIVARTLHASSGDSSVGGA